MLGSGPEGLHTQDAPHTSCRGEKDKPTSVKRENTAFKRMGETEGIKSKVGLWLKKKGKHKT